MDDPTYRKMTEPEIRAEIQRFANPCPCCGGAVVVQFEGPDGAIKSVEALAAAGFRVKLMKIEDAEEELREGAYIRRFDEGG